MLPAPLMVGVRLPADRRTTERRQAKAKGMGMGMGAPN